MLHLAPIPFQKKYKSIYSGTTKLHASYKLSQNALISTNSYKQTHYFFLTSRFWGEKKHNEFDPDTKMCGANTNWKFRIRVSVGSAKIPLSINMTKRTNERTKFCRSRRLVSKRPQLIFSPILIKTINGTF